MDKRLYLFFLLFVISNVLFAQSSVHWSGSSGNNLWHEEGNWEEGFIPTSQDIVYFEDVGSIIVEIGEAGHLIDSVSELHILGSSEIEFQSYDINQDRILGVLDYLEISEESAISILTISPGNVAIYVEGSAEIWGSVKLDNDGSFGPNIGTGGDIPVLYFREGSTFIAGENLTAISAFNDLSQTVFFDDGATYEHRGGPSPFGGVGDIVSFSQYSNYDIYTNVSSHVHFSGNNYGNINVYSSDWLFIPGVSTATNPFVFNDLTVFGGGLSFEGEPADNIVITGNIIEAVGGDINLTAGDYILFSNIETPVYIKGSGSVNFNMLSAANFTFIDAGAELILEKDIDIGTVDGTPSFFKVEGILDCSGNNINAFNASITLENGSLLKTAHQDGVLGSVADILIETGAMIEYYGSINPQDAGLPAGAILHEIFVSKDAGSVHLNTQTETTYLSLNNGYLNISDQTLIIQSGIEYNGGDLQTDPLSSRLEFMSVDDSNLSIGLKTPLALSDFVLSITGNLELFGDQDFTVSNSLELYSGKLNIKNSDFYMGDGMQINAFFDASTYIIAEDEGFIKKYFDSSIDIDFHIPIGTSEYFSDLKLYPNVNSEYSLRCKKHVYAEGIAGYQYEDNVLDMTWYIRSDEAASETILQIIWESGSNLETEPFNYSNSFINKFGKSDTIWDNDAAQSIRLTDVTAPYTGLERTIYENGLFSVTSQELNNTPKVRDQLMYVFENSPNESVIGKLEAIDPDPGQSLSFYIQEDLGDQNPFRFEETGLVILNNQSLLDQGSTPEYTFTFDVCDDGNPVICKSFQLNIVVEGPQVEGLEISNFLSPNNDTFNDTWIIRGTESASADVFVYNSNGQLVFEAVNYQNTWAGTAQGRKLPAGIYYYIIKTDVSEYRGTLTLVR
jgi:gliding motility-associated-like protein